MKNIVYRFILFPVLLKVLTGCGSDKSFQSVVSERQLKDGWSVESSVKANSTGDIISKKDFDASEWYKTSVPATVMAALIANGEHTDVFMGDNISKIDTSRFRVSWWYRTSFNIEDAGNNTELIFEGINYRANIWLNGSKIASADTLFGGFRIFCINVSEFTVSGEISLQSRYSIRSLMSLQ